MVSSKTRLIPTILLVLVVVIPFVIVRACRMSLPGPSQKKTDSVSLPRLAVNSATITQLEAIPGIGPSLAERIVSDRELRGPFSGPNDLQRVRGIGPRLAEVMSGYLYFDPVPDGPLSPPVASGSRNPPSPAGKGNRQPPSAEGGADK